MDDERTLHETDARLRAALHPGDAVSQRIAARALEQAGAPRRQSERPLRLRELAVLMLVALAVAIGVSAWKSRRATSVAVAVAPALPLAISAQGSIVVVEHPDGRRWIVGPPPERRAGGNYVIVVER